MKLLPLIVLVALSATACATTQAKSKSPVDHPALEVPPVPPRVIEPAPPPTQPEPVPDLPVSPAISKPRPPTRETAKPPAEPPKPETQPVVETPPPTTAQTAQVPPLRTTATPDGAAARQVHEIIDRANSTLNGSVDYQRLTKQQKAQYDNAKQLLKQAEEAIKLSNFEFARNLADKAEKIARELAGK